MNIVIGLELNTNNKLELAYQTYLAGHYKEALQFYSEMTNEEELIPKALEGIILCKIAMNDIDDEVN